MTAAAAAKQQTETPEEYTGKDPATRAARRADRDSADAARSTDTVLVGCKLPHGFIMEVVQPGAFPCDKDGRPQLSLAPVAAGTRVIIKGSNSERKDSRKAQGLHMFATTRVPRSLWDAWYARHQNEAYVRNGLVFVAEDKDEAEGLAKDQIGQRTGLEALAAEKDPRMPKSQNPNTQVEVDPDSRPETRKREEPVAV